MFKIGDNIAHRRGAVFATFLILVGIGYRVNHSIEVGYIGAGKPRKRAGKPRPYEYDTVEMVRHNDVCVQINNRKMMLCFVPNITNDHPCVIQPHFVIYNIPEYPFPILCAYRYKIRPCPGIIIFLQPKGTAVMNIWIVFRLIGHILFFAIGRGDRINGRGDLAPTFSPPGTGCEARWFCRRYPSG